MASLESSSSEFAHTPEQAGQVSEQHDPLQDGIELTWGERLSNDAFWVFSYLQGIGYTKYSRELARIEGIDFDAGLDELRGKGLLDEDDSEHPTVLPHKL